MSVLIVTSLGDLVVDLHTNKCPLTCKNFLKLCKIKYYNGCLFHTVQKDFTAQTGDPTGTGTGGDSVYKFLYGDQARFFSDEIHIDLKHSKTGTVAMASAGENLNASQFYITLRDDLDYLDGKHTVFGEVAEGFETLTRINEAYVDDKGRPYKNIRIKHTYILEDPYDDPSQLSEFIPEASPEGKPKDEVDDEVRLEDDWVPMDEQLNPAELEEVIRSKEAHSRAVVLESIGDIPDAEIKPPDNVLFVCKLNPVTEDEDLNTIFSRFGTVSSAEIIRDHKTGDSLCYAFIEFEDKRACEEAYFKMDNALIDDRRIHVDFSQSVAKLWSQYRRKDQKGKGGGCFKCGSTDHIAKDCTGDATMKQPQTKYILKDDNTQRGGDNSRYDMVFDGDDNPESPRQDVKHRKHDRDDPVERKVREENFKDHRSSRHQDTVRDRYGDRSREHGGNGENKARYDRGARDLDSNADKKDRDRHKGRHGNDYRWKVDHESRKEEDDGYKRKDERDSGRRYEEDNYKHKDERDPRRRDEDDRRNTDSSHLERRNDRGYRKRPEDSGKQDVKIDSGRRKRSPGDDDYKNGRKDEDYRHRKEERGYKRQDIEADEDHKRRREDGDYRHRREERGHKRQHVEADDYPHKRHHGDRR
ncbi:peptidyl-prolyl cis-trans isomerase CYP59 isoform X1 [Vigna radiata var. radiata]|uniref:Peptidyl-prolyl cis-trans isomerase n=1 Tax=Vigna radiata var. radiata TaxID=3916 RepID=A0A1S3TJG7_VIGRR|nr:peptidyl-prolyl cis-trans isomerase CYP59 isoform X1 [Vigna radiata var. radiata]